MKIVSGILEIRTLMFEGEKKICCGPTGARGVKKRLLLL